jgi:hypothetical protein
VCRGLGRRFVLIDRNPAAIEVMRERLATAGSRGPGEQTALPLAGGG